LGSAVQHLSLNPVCPVLILKDFKPRKSKNAGSYRWCVCSDGSQKSINAFHSTVRLMDKAKDHLVVLVVGTKNVNPEEIGSTMKGYFTTSGVQGSVEVIDKRPDKLVHEEIVEALMNWASPDKYVDFVAVGNRGADFSSHSDKKYLGSVANGVIRFAKLNVLFVA